MTSNSLTPRWAIPGIGVLRPRYDAVRIVSTATVGALRKLLPVAALKTASHKFEVVTYNGPDPRLRSEIRVTGAEDLLVWQMLAGLGYLGNYRVVDVEVAFDVNASSVDDARKKLFATVGLLTKPRHFRKYLLMVDKPDETPGRGQIAQPTFYFEDRQSRVRLKCYCRYLKLKDGAFGGPCIRLEWSLRGKAAIERHLSGNTIQDLLSADLNKFAKDNLLLEKVDRAALEKVISGQKLNRKDPPVLSPIKAMTVAEQFKDPAYRSRRAVDLMLRNFAYRELAKFDGDWQHALWACQNSPAQIRGYLNRLQKIESLRRGQSRLTSQQKKGLRKRGRPRQGRKRQRAISAYRINGCFKRVQLEPV